MATARGYSSCSRWQRAAASAAARKRRSRRRTAAALKLSGHGKEIWVFDIDETTLFTLPYQAKHGYGHTTNASFLQYVARVSALSLQGTLRLYHRLLQLEIKPVFLSGRTEDQIGVTTHNLLSQGYSSWEKLLLQPVGLQTSTQAFKIKPP
uniref:Acid phosphatase n=1 Tax=Oryza nivara TaxID=4536 RepID=A0A0E0HAM0_ORYNI